MRARVKGRIERLLQSRAVARATRWRLRGKALVLAYHGIHPDDEPPAGERALSIARSRFAAQLDAMAEIAEIVPLERLADPADGRPRIAITFDDAYRGAVTLGVAELARRGLPATIFVAPGRLEDHVFWWDALGHGRPALDETLRRHALDALAGDDERVRAWATAERVGATDDLPAYARSASVAELRAALEWRGLSLGSHSWSHANLARLEDDALARELARPLLWLRDRFPGRVGPWLAYPYGSESALVRRAAADAGYAAAFLVRGGWFDPASVGSMAMPRLNVPAGLTLDGLRARLVGALPV
jgi:peptidoglycan/xylan/chitin deacetylase (PgdA/CDA1 family)